MTRIVHSNGPEHGFRRRIVLPHERLFLDHLPCADRYHKSFMHRDMINFVVVTRCASFPKRQSGLTLKMQQYGLRYYDVHRRSLEALEKTGNGHRVRQALSRAHVAHRWRFSKRGWGAVCQRVGGWECKSFRRRQFRCVCYIANAPPHILNCSNLERHDQHDQTRIHAESLLLGTSERPSAGHPRRVCAHSWDRFAMV